MLLPTSLSDDLSAALREHRSAPVNEHFGHARTSSTPGLRCQHDVAGQPCLRSVTYGGIARRALPSTACSDPTREFPAPVRGNVI